MSDGFLGVRVGMRWVGVHVRLVGVGEGAQKACRSSVVDQRLPCGQGRCFEFLNLWPRHVLGSALLLRAKQMNYRVEQGLRSTETQLLLQSAL